jgi:hypothetical protein
MASPRKKASAQKPGAFRSSSLIDRGSFLMGLTAGAMVIAIIVFIYVMAQPSIPRQGTPLPPSKGPQASEQKLPEGLSFSLHNNGKDAVFVATDPNSSVNLTGRLEPNETRGATVAVPKGCGADLSQCMGAITVTYVFQNGTSPQGAGSNSSGNGSSGGSGSGTGTPPGEIKSIPLSVTTSSISPALEDARYSAALEAIGGTGEYAWTVTGLPSGLECDQSGLIHGAAVQQGTFQLLVSVSDGQSTESSTLSLVVH